MRLELEINGQKVIVESELAGTDLWLHHKGQTWLRSFAPVATRRAGGRKTDAGELLAPMPGKVTKVLTQVDAIVKAGEVLIVMEAMKMEYILKSPQAGRITSLSCELGQQVNLGQKLLQIDPVAVKS